MFDVSPDCIRKQHKVYLSNVCKFILEYHIIVREAYSVHMILFIFVIRITIEFLTLDTLRSTFTADCKPLQVT